jgi:CRISPR-associated protein Cas1
VKTLHEIPKFSDRWSHLYLEMGLVDKDADGLNFSNKAGVVPLPIDQISLLMLGPGTSITQQAMKALAENNCLVSWVGQEGVRMYAHSTGGTFSSRRLLIQAKLASNEESRQEVARRMYEMRFIEKPPKTKSIEQLRGMEGLRVRAAYEEASAKYGIKWSGRFYNQDDWDEADPINKALSCANACLYGVCHAAIISAGYSAALGFVHTGKMLSFVYDVADFYKTKLSIPIAFMVAAREPPDLEHYVRLACRDVFHQARLTSLILPDIAEALGVSDDPGEDPSELEGRAVSMASGTENGGLRGKPESQGS